MEDSRRFPHYAPALPIIEDPLPDYHRSSIPYVPALPSTVLAQEGVNTQAIFQFDDIPSDSNESTPSSASSRERGRSRRSAQTRFTHDYHEAAHYLAADYDGHHHSTPLDPRHATAYSQMIIFPDESQPSSVYDRTTRQPIYGSSVPRPIRSSHKNSPAQKPTQYTRARGSYEGSLAPHLDWKEVEISAAIRMQDMGQPTSWYHTIPGERMSADASSTSYASLSMSANGYSDHRKHPDVGRCELCGYKDYWPIVEQHRKSCVGPQYK